MSDNTPTEPAEPTEPTTPETPATPEVPATPETPAVPAADATEQLTQDLAVRDAEIANLRGQLNDAATDKATKEQLAIDLASTLTARNELKTKLDAAITSRSSAIDTMTQATQSMVDRVNELESRLAAYDQERETERTTSAAKLAETNAKLVRYDVILKEFPQLLTFVDRILASEDVEAVRADARAFNDTRNADLQALQRVAVGTVLSTVPGSTPPSAPTTPPGPAGQEQLQQQMQDAIAANDPVAFEKAKREYLEAYEASRGAA